MINRSSRLGGPILFASAGIFQYLGAALAVGLFVQVAPSGVVWWRIAAGSVFLMLEWRPWRQEWTWRKIGVAVSFGLALAGMNFLFYEAIARLSLGTTVAIEFVGPVAVAVFRGRTKRTWVAALLAFVGVALIGGLGLNLGSGSVLTGFLFALGAAGAWAAYILIGSTIADTSKPGHSLSVVLAVASVLLLPFFGSQAFAPFTGGGGVVGVSAAAPSALTASPSESPWILFACLVGVGLLSTTLPYSLEAIAFTKLSASLFALLTALLPATSTIVGATALGQVPNLAQILGLVMVSAAVWIAGRGKSV